MKDVVIVGGGPAGAAAAVHLARRGIDVEVLEQGSFPHRKACGEGLFSGGAEELRGLGVLHDVAAASVRLTSMRFRLGDAVAEAPLPDSEAPHLGVRRDVLDARLAQAVVDSGATLSTGVQVRALARGDRGFALETTGGVREARVIIAADGINSRLRRDAGLQRAVRSDRYGISAHLRQKEAVPPRIEVVAEDVFELYFTPVGEELVNIGMLFRSGIARRFKGSPASEFAALLQQMGIDGELVDEPLMAGPFPAAATALFKDNLILCGDAAGFFDPITGEGMSHALRSAHLCADAVSSYLKDGDRQAFARYARRQRAMERNPTLVARLMLFLAAHQTIGYRVLLNLREHPETLTKLIGINNGSAGFADLRPRDLAAMVLGR